MKLRLKKIKPTEIKKPPFVHLQQFYEFEAAPITEWTLTKSGLYDQDKIRKTWSKHGVDFYILYANTLPIGFAVISLSSLLNHDKDTRDLSEFFIMPSHRKQGAGKWFACKLFKRYKGKWETRQLKEAKPARRFWHKVIKDFAPETFTERKINKKDWQGYLQQFIAE